MPLETFKASESLTLGVELELQLVNTYDMDLSSSANDLLELLRRKPFPGVVTPEMTQSMIEIATDVQHLHGPLLARAVLTGRGLLVLRRSPAAKRYSERRQQPTKPMLNQNARDLPITSGVGALSKMLRQHGRSWIVGSNVRCSPRSREPQSGNL